MKRNATDVIITLVLILFVIIYAGYQLFTFLYSPYETETAFTYTVADSFSTSGILVRDEAPLEESVGVSTVGYVVEDGAKVAEGETIAEIYTNDTQAQNVNNLRDVERQIEVLNSAQTGTENYFGQTDVITRQISEQVNLLAQAGHDGDGESLEKIRDNLTLYLNKKKIATGVISDLSQSISELEATRDELEASLSASGFRQITSPQRGYFSQYSDGWEQILTTDSVEAMSLEEIVTLLNTVEDDTTDRIGKIMTSHNWLYVTVMDKLESENLSPGQTVSLSFAGRGGEAVPVYVQDIITEEGSDNAAVLFRCDYIDSYFINSRCVSAEIQFTNYSGLRISKEAIRFNDAQEAGVFILKGDEVRFKKVDEIYDDGAYLISSLQPPDDSYVQLFDEIIIKGSDLYDGKHIG